jgi:TolB-like protein/DNA-binding winged helix-turn-helix (wHTH) protein
MRQHPARVIMASPTGASSVIRFGAFELDTANGELRKAGVSLKIHPQPLQVLLLLTEHAGQTVTREEIQRCLWGDNTFADFERGINFCVNQIRATLGDDAEKPRYVETLPRRGYRFIAPIKIDITATTPGLDERVSEGPTDQGFRSVAVPAGEAATLLHSRTAAPTRMRSYFLAALGLVCVIAATFGWQWRARQRVVLIRSLAVLPFENLSGDAAQDYFADGMTEALITELGKISALRVISRQSMMQYKGTKKSAPEIASELKVDAVIEGSVQRVGDSARVSVQLIEAAPERHLWAESYDRQVRDVFALQGEMARTVAKEIKVTLTPQEEARLAATRAVNPFANEAYFRGRYFLDRRTKADIDEGLVAIQQAIEFDPTFAPAYASLSEAYLALGLYEPARGTELLAKAQAASRKALELDDSLSAAHYTLAAIRGIGWDWSGAEVEYQRAIKLNPSNALAHLWYSDLLIILDRVTEAEAESRRAEELDPVSLQIYGAVTGHLYYARRYGELIEHCQGWVKRNPNLEWNYHHCLGAAYVQMGRHEEAIAELREALKSSTIYEHTATELANALAVAGKREEALKVLGQVQNVPWRTFGAALVHTGLGEKDEAFRSLEKAVDLRAPLITLLKVDPRFDSLRKDPRFPKLLRRMNLPS